VESTETITQLLPEDRNFNDLLLPYLAPYLIYVVLSSIPEAMMSSEMSQSIKLAATCAALLYYRKTYRFGSLRPLHGFIALLALPVALLSWIAPFYLLTALGITDVMSAGAENTVSMLSFYLRLVPKQASIEL
jgi:fucose 4-O-acetylase-like acetyltransferase